MQGACYSATLALARAVKLQDVLALTGSHVALSQRGLSRNLQAKVLEELIRTLKITWEGPLPPVLVLAGPAHVAALAWMHYLQCIAAGLSRR